MRSFKIIKRMFVTFVYRLAVGDWPSISSRSIVDGWLRANVNCNVNGSVFTCSFLESTVFSYRSFSTVFLLAKDGTIQFALVIFDTGMQLQRNRFRDNQLGCFCTQIKRFIKEHLFKLIVCLSTKQSMQIREQLANNQASGVV